ncbi:matrixin family metalloprotease [Bacillus cereus]|uniref:matrixin family metalloprotease n=1 Tax=Bacillus cereus TaxID=1396 RepID=UPI000BF91AFF|nr:matrixin family metalloprotease [Bacillus cereus]PFU19227.1 hypothetical protein COK76_31570 [Bacillus cereus]
MQLKSTPVNGFKWGHDVRRWAIKLYITPFNSNRYKNMWINSVNNWNNSESVFKYIANTNAGIRSAFAYPIEDKDATYAGITHLFGSKKNPDDEYSIIDYALAFFNTAIIDDLTDEAGTGVGTHELGHMLGLGHAPEGESSVMVPAIIVGSDGNPTTPTTPQPQDIETVNEIIYPDNVNTNIEPNNEKWCLVEDEVQICEGVWYGFPTWAFHIENEDNLYQEADLVTMGTVLRKNETLYTKKQELASFKTPCDIKTNYIVKGDKTLLNKTISIIQLGGNAEGITVISNGTTPLKEQDNVLLYLKKGYNDYYYLINEDYSLFFRDTDGTYKNAITNKIHKNIEFY